MLVVDRPEVDLQLDVLFFSSHAWIRSSITCFGAGRHIQKSMKPPAEPQTCYRRCARGVLVPWTWGMWPLGPLQAMLLPAKPPPCHYLATDRQSGADRQNRW